jgi:hypothetical protein
VKFLINGNSFYYGRAGAFYTPLPNRDDVDDTGSQISLIGMSQRPKIFLDPTTNKGGTLELPFFWPYNAFSIPDVDWRAMGRINVQGFTALQHMQNSDQPITITVFAWATDVSLSVPTSVNMSGLDPQMAMDEYDGPVSKPANVLAASAGRLANAPVIGPYALATQLAASAVAAIARIFGYSRPAQIDAPNRMIHYPAGIFAPTNIPDVAQKLTLDVKQETTIDPRVMGLSDVDELSLSSFIQRESFLTSFSYSQIDAPDQTLFTTWVTPCLWDKETEPESQTKYHPTHLPMLCFHSQSGEEQRSFVLSLLLLLFTKVDWL